jgi:HK97 family phage prohead protease
VCSTSTEDGHGTIVEQDWNLTRYLKNPVVLFEHGQGGASPFADTPSIQDRIPIATATDVRVDRGALRATIVFPPEGRSANSDAVWDALDSGLLRAVSVGFRPGKVAEVENKQTGKIEVRLSKNELFEISIVGVPSNPDAVAERAFVRSLATNTRKPDMEFLELLAKRFACATDAAAVLAALDALNTRANDASSVARALNLDPNAAAAELTRSVVQLAERAARVDVLEPEVTRLQADIGARDTAAAEREVDWLIKRGKSYGMALTDNTRNALTAYRRSNPAGFAADYKAALDGLAAFDRAESFDSKTAIAPADSAPVAPVGDSLDARASAWAAKRSIPHSQAYGEVVRGLDRTA